MGRFAINVYVKSKSSKIVYQTGCTPVLTDGSSYSCTSISWVLNDTAISQVNDEVYYLGGISSFNNQSASSYYTSERGSSKYLSSMSINWTGKVVLINPSDYAYTFAYGVDDTRYSDTYNCDSSMPSSSWVRNVINTQFTLKSRTINALIFDVHTGGNINGNYAKFSHYVNPVVYLKPETVLEGTGTSDDPYVIVS